MSEKKEIKNLCVIVGDINNEYQNNILKGIRKYANEYEIIVSVFSAFTGYYTDSKLDKGEYNIFNLINYEKFDGFIIVTNTIVNPNTLHGICNKIRALGLPAVSLNSDIDESFYAIDIDNKAAMQDIVEHLICHHNCKNINYISGPISNPDAKLRLMAFRETTQKYGIQIDERRIYQGRFLGEDGPIAVKEFIDSNLPFPDAIICANDEMALTTIADLEKRGFNVPDDVKVTGFDNIYSARTNMPKLSSVECPLFLSGYKSCVKLANHYANKTQVRYEILKTTPIFTESCDCHSEYDEDINNFKKKNFMNIKMYRNGIDLINRMINDITESETLDFTLQVLKKYIVDIKCEKFFLCLNTNNGIDGKDKRHSFMTKNKEYLIDGYSEQISVILAYDNGEFVKLPDFNSADMLPVPHDSEEGAMYYFSPIHYRDRCMGYCIICNSAYPLDSQLYYMWLTCIGIALENIRKLAALSDAVDELDMLYVTDQLTGIYNRHGFEKMTARLFTECIKHHWLTMVMFIDLDGLKYINDTFGHNAGDEAISKMAAEMARVCRNGEICARLGGDEYAIFAVDYDQNRAEYIIAEIQRRLDDFNSVSGLPYKVACSIGYCLEFPTEGTTIDSLMSIADNNMYQNKIARRAAGLTKPRGEG